MKGNLQTEAEVEQKGGEAISSRFFSSLIDATCLVALLTAALYFWGYIYFAIFTESLGASYHGVSLSVQEYLIASWFGVLCMLLVVGVTAFFWGLIENELSKIIQPSKTKSKPATGSGQKSFNPRFGTMVFVAGIVLLIGAMLMRFQARMESESILKKPREVVLRTADGHLIEGRFLYLRDFGSMLLVREMNADMKTAIGFRWLKEGSYGSYTVLDAKTETTAAAEPPRLRSGEK